MFEWKKISLGEICKTNTTSYSNKEGWKFVNYLDTGSITGNEIEEIQYIDLTAEKLPSRAKRKVRYNSIVYSTVRPNQLHYGIIKEQPENFLVSTGFTVIDVDENVADAEYVYYWLIQSVVTEQLQALAEQSTSAYPSIKSSDLEALELELPPLKIQKMIAGILVALDKKRKNNTQINRNLEEQARTVFTSWFVRFECFDEPMKESPIGYEIPESLDLVQIGDLNPILETGRRPKGGAVSEGIPSIGAESVKGLGNVNLSSNKYIPIDFAAKQKTGKVNGYELMIYKDGGKPGEFQPHFSMFGEGYPFDYFYINEHVFKLDFGNRGFNELAYFYFQTDYVMNWLESNGGKAAIPGINQNVVNSIWIVNPDHPKVKEYCEWVQPLFTQILKNCYSNMKLAELRDTLLPKLMSGELEVSDLES